MDKKEYIIRQLARTKHKKYEQYVITRIFHLLDNQNLKFVTQQYVYRTEGHACHRSIKMHHLRSVQSAPPTRTHKSPFFSGLSIGVSDWFAILLRSR